MIEVCAQGMLFLRVIVLVQDEGKAEEGIICWVTRMQVASCLTK